MSLLIIGVLMSVFGLAMYYGLPLALISLNLQLLLYIFVGLILAMLFGLSILSLNLEVLLENLFLYILFFWEAAAVMTLIEKNFVAHRVRNRKTFLLFSISLAFIVFISVSYQIQLDEFLYSTQQSNGCMLMVRARGYDSSSQPRKISTIAVSTQKYVSLTQLYKSN